MRRVWLFAIAFLVCGFVSLQAQETLVDIQKVYPEDLEVGGFELSRDQDVQIEAVGLHYRSERVLFMLGNAWIINSDTREVVWELPQSEEEPYDERDVVTFSGPVSLPKGKYEVYYSAFPYYSWRDWDDDWDHSRRNWSRSHRGGSWWRWFGRVFDERWSDDWYYDEFRSAFRDFKVVVRGDGRKLDRDDIERNQEAYRQDAAIAMRIRRDERYETQGFALERPMELNLYALGEARPDGNFDYAVILNSNTFERVWQLTYRDSEHAGGAIKNRMRRETINLPAGKYVAFYVSDDSHSPREWNSPPPYDPEFWGLTVRAKNPDMKKYIKKFDYEGYKIENAVIDFTRLRDDEFRTKVFTLKKPMKLRVYAIGEGRDGDMYDYGWIVDAKTHKRVWEMDYYETEHAGGGRKNRVFDGVVEFEAGNYIAYFVTDDSHSFRRWNTSPPLHQEHWGLTVVPAEENYNRSDIADYVPEQDKNVLAQLVRMRDHDFERTRFTLKKDSKVRIYAIGEGKDGRMYDTGWIEDAESGRIVWEMTYRMTQHAGGAHKNRMYNDVISLKAGEYIVLYETDGSHSFNDWNSSPPYDPVNWGITVYLVED